MKKELKDTLRHILHNQELIMTHLKIHKAVKQVKSEKVKPKAAIKVSKKK